MNRQITSETSEPITLSDSANGMTIFIKQGRHPVEMGVDQAAAVAVEILNHIDKMAKLHLGDKAPKFIYQRNPDEV